MSLATPRPKYPLSGFPGLKCRHEPATWEVFTRRDIYEGVDIDEYRAKYGADEGEVRFFYDNPVPTDTLTGHGNMLVIGGSSLLWQCVAGNGTATGSQALTFLNNANCYIGVGTSATASTAIMVDLQGAANSVNRQFNVADTGFPLLYDSVGNGAGVVTVSNTTNAAPIVVTTSAQSPAFNANDFVYVNGVGGNLAANGVFQANPVNSTSLTLVGTTGNGTYTSGGIVTRANVFYVKSTFGTAVANFAWNEWCLCNINAGVGAVTTGRILNRAVQSLGTKANTASWAFSVAVSLA